MEVSTIVIIFVATIIGVVIGYFISQSQSRGRLQLQNDRHSHLTNELASHKQSLSQLHSEKQLLVQQVGHLQGSLTITQQELSSNRKLLEEASKEKQQYLTTRIKLEASEQRLAEQKKTMDEFRITVESDFRLLANSIMDEKSRSMSELNSSALKNILEPLQINLKEFKSKVEETYQNESRERFSLEKKLHDLIGLNKQLGEEANNLTQALKYNNKAQGNWGEMILESLLEFSGLTKGREYFIQEFLKDNAGSIVKDEEGKSLQPDVLIHFPDQRKIIIDSKMSLIGFEKYTSAVSDEERTMGIKEHIRSLRQHIDGLSKKNYPRSAGLALDHVILFVPVEPAFLLAIKEDAQLWRYAYEKRVLLVSATNLLAVLKIVADIWKVEKQSQHAIEIAEKAGQLYDKFALFIDNMETVGNHLNKATDAYHEAMKKLSDGKGNIMRQVAQLKTMGAKANKSLPDNLVKRSFLEENDE